MELPKRRWTGRRDNRKTRPAPGRTRSEMERRGSLPAGTVTRPSPFRSPMPPQNPGTGRGGENGHEVPEPGREPGPASTALPSPIDIRQDNMPRQRTHHTRSTCVLLDDFAERLKRFKEASGLTWAELSRRLGTHPQTVRRWRDDGLRPNGRHLMALLRLAVSLGLDHLLTTGASRPRAVTGFNTTTIGGLHP